MKRKLIVLVLVAAVVAGVAVCWPRGPKEPEYQGKKLSEWIAKAFVENTPEAMGRAREAIKANGTNALVFFLHEFTVQQSRRSIRLKRDIWNFIGGRANPALRFEWRYDRVYLAQQGIVLMAPDAAPALPTLAGYLDDPERDWRAVVAMGGCGEAALSYLLQLAARTNNPKLASYALLSLGEVAKTTEAAVPPLLLFLNDTNKSTRKCAAAALNGVRIRSDLVVPALLNALCDTNDTVRSQAAGVLGELGQAAKSALPGLLTLMRRDPEEYVAWTASNAVFKIDPTAFQARGPRSETGAGLNNRQ